MAFLLAGPLHTMSHEAAHLAFARAFGWHARITHEGTRVEASIAHRLEELERSEPGGSEYRSLRLRRAAMLTAGLGANVAMALLGLSLLAVRRRRPFRRAVDLPAAVMAMSGVVLVLAGAQARRADDGGDLDRLCALYGWPEAAVEQGAWLLGAALCAMAILLYREHRWRVFVPAALLGGEAGYWLWDHVLAVRLLP